jgi:mono/diheme cytochrome c family protein
MFMSHAPARRTLPLSLAIIAILALLVAACGAAATPTATPVPPTATKAPAAPTTAPAAPTATKAPAAATAAPAAPTATTAPAAPTATTAPAAAVSFAKDVLPIFQKNCTSCHGGGSPRAGLNLSTYAGVTKGSSSGTVITAGNVDKSVLYGLVKSGAMPPSGGKLAEADLMKISDWIKAGALNN